MFSVSGFALTSTVNKYIFIIFNNLGLLPALLGYIIVHVWNLKIHMHITNLCTPWKFANGAENLVLQAVTGARPPTLCVQLPH
jgi:hypothetical protein